MTDDKKEIARLKGKVNRLLDALGHLLDRPENTCCCGDPMDQHTAWDNHAPLDIVDAYLHNVLKDNPSEEIV